MPYRVEFRPSADRAMDRLPRSEQSRITRKIQQLEQDPRPHGCVKLAGHPDLWRIRAGDYRVVYTIDDGRQRIEVTVVAHRRESYRGL